MSLLLYIKEDAQFSRPCFDLKAVRSSMSVLVWEAARRKKRCGGVGGDVIVDNTSRGFISWPHSD